MISTRIMIMAMFVASILISCNNDNSAQTTTLKQLNENSDTLFHVDSMDVQYVAKIHFEKDKKYPDRSGSIADATIDNGVLYALSDVKGRVFRVDLKTAQVTDLTWIDSIINFHIAKFYTCSKLCLYEQTMVFSFLKGVILVDLATMKEVDQVETSNNINNVSIVNGEIYVFMSDSIFLYNNGSLKSIRKSTHLSGDPFFQTIDTIYYGDFTAATDLRLKFYSPKENVEGIYNFQINGAFPDLYLGTITSKYFVCVPLLKRDQLIFVNKETGKVVRIIQLSSSIFTTTDDELLEEQGARPNLTVTIDQEDNIYLIWNKKQETRIYKVSKKNS